MCEGDGSPLTTNTHPLQKIILPCAAGGRILPQPPSPKKIFAPLYLKFLHKTTDPDGRSEPPPPPDPFFQPSPSNKMPFWIQSKSHRMVMADPSPPQYRLRICP